MFAERASSLAFFAYEKVNRLMRIGAL